MTTTITADNGTVSGSAGLKSAADSSGILALATGSGTTAVTIDASQNVGIGTSSPSNKLHVIGPTGAYASRIGVSATGAQLFTNYVLNDGVSPSGIGYTGSDGSSFDVAASNYLRFITNSVERARIDSSGNLLVGATSGFVAPSGGSAQFVNGSSSQIFVRNSSATSGKYFQMGVNSSNAFVVYNNSNTGMFLTDGSTSWAANSDERVKTTLVPFANAVAKVSTLRAGTGRYLTDDESVSRSFLIAQDVQAVLPEAVDVQDDEQGTLGLRYQDLIPLLTAAIQEQQALITTLTERITALEAK